MRINSVHDQVDVVPNKVSDCNEETDLYLNGSSSQHSIVSPKGGESVLCDSTTLDRFCQKNKTYPDLIKVDVDGAGHLVVKGATEVLSHTQDWLIEIHTSDEKDVFRRELESRGYVVSKIGEREHWFATTK